MALRLLVRRAGEREPSLLVCNPARGWAAFQAAVLDRLHVDARTHAITKVCLIVDGKPPAAVAPADLCDMLRENDTLDITLNAVATPGESPATPGVHCAVGEALATPVPRGRQGAAASSAAKPRAQAEPPPARHGDAGAEAAASSGSPFAVGSLKHAAWRALRQVHPRALTSTELAEASCPWYAWKPETICREWQMRTSLDRDAVFERVAKLTYALRAPGSCGGCQQCGYCRHARGSRHGRQPRPARQLPAARRHRAEDHAVVPAAAAAFALPSAGVAALLPAAAVATTATFAAAPPRRRHRVRNIAAVVAVAAPAASPTPAAEPPLVVWPMLRKRSATTPAPAIVATGADEDVAVAEGAAAAGGVTRRKRSKRANAAAGAAASRLAAFAAPVVENKADSDKTELPPGFCAPDAAAPAPWPRAAVALLGASSRNGTPFAAVVPAAVAAAAAASAPSSDVDADAFHARAIAPGLWLGASSVAADAAWLHERRITHILNVAREVPVFFPGRFCYLRLELVDSPDAAAQLRELLPRACDFIDAALARRGEGVLVHCALGKSRSVAVVLGYALLRAGWDLPRAAALLRDGRQGGIGVNWGFEAMLQRLQDERDGTAGQRRLRGPAGHA